MTILSKVLVPGAILCLLCGGVYAKAPAKNSGRSTAVAAGHAGVAAQSLPGRAEMNRIVTESLDFSVEQAMRLAASLKDDPEALPRNTDWNGKLGKINSADWTSGFFPGELWYLYEYSRDPQVKAMAGLYTRRIEREQHTTNNHDVGFIIFCSVGNQYRITGGDSARLRDMIVTTARSLATRYRPGAGIIQSWDIWEDNPRGWRCPVIIDNMMNLELMMQAAKLSGDTTLSFIARRHADQTLRNHFRPDYSCCHVTDYDPQTGAVLQHTTWQGYADKSAWARGQAWGLYGYTMMFRETGDSTYLDQAIRIADYILPRLPEDKIPYWDFDAPNIPDAYRDASAGAVIASALFELGGYVPEALARRYFDVAQQQVVSMSSPAYRAAPGRNGNFLLRHSVGSMPHSSEIDVPIVYADYYYVEALMRCKKLLDSGVL